MKQQQQIRSFLIREFGEDRGSALFSLQERRLETIIAGTENKTKNQMKTLTQTILPRVALYKALQESGKDYYDITIQKCLWHTACVENGCPELCRLFCDAGAE